MRPGSRCGSAPGSRTAPSASALRRLRAAPSSGSAARSTAPLRRSSPISWSCEFKIAAFMREPAFWWQGGAAPAASPAATLLAPAASLYGAIAAWRMSQPGRRAPVPVLCVGNFTLGGAGKTPAAIALARLVMAAEHRPFFLSRGYGGRLAGPILLPGYRTWHGVTAPSPRVPSGRSRPSSTGYGEGRGEGASPQAQTRGEAPSPGLSPQAGRGEDRLRDE